MPPNHRLQPTAAGVIGGPPRLKRHVGPSRIMNDSERTVCLFLESLRLGPVEYEPDGKNPPDFLVAGRIAVEARRLNENEEIEGGHRGLEVTAKPLHRAVVKALAQSGPPSGAHSWFVHYTVRRPLPSWKEIERLLSDAVLEFRSRSDDPPSELRLGRSLRLSFHCASRRHDTLLVLGSSSDHDAGVLLVAELSQNLRICIDEKIQKVNRVRDKYEQWWLAFEDRISYGALDHDDVEQLRTVLGPVSGFDQVILVNPLNPAKAVHL